MPYASNTSNHEYVVVGSKYFEVVKALILAAALISRARLAMKFHKDSEYRRNTPPSPRISWQISSPAVLWASGERYQDSDIDGKDIEFSHIVPDLGSGGKLKRR